MNENEKNINLIGMLKQYPNLLRIAGDELKDDKDIVLKIVKQNGLLIEHASKRLKNDKEVVIEAVKQNGLAIKFVNVKDKDIVLEAVKSNGLAIEHVPVLFRKDKEVVLSAVKNAGNALIYADKVFKDDIDIVLNAIKSSSFSLNYASNRLRNNKELIIEAINNDNSGLYIYDVSDEMINDKDIALCALKKSNECINSIGLTLLNNKLFLYEIKDIIIENRGDENYKIVYKNLINYQREDDLMDLTKNKKEINKRNKL